MCCHNDFYIIWKFLEYFINEVSFIFLENAGKCQKIESEIKWPPCIIKLQEDVIAKLDETTKYKIDIELIGETVEKYIIEKELVSN